ncbi:MAG: aminodeoxychorismate synthase component I [Candidatus Omnitrophica bacterium]|nr:aminodeoxychorismate synthase component I [Candidatus Omnitrophota bacterium]
MIGEFKPKRDVIDLITEDPGVFLETKSPFPANDISYLFKDFQEIITFNYGDDLAAFFNKLEETRKKGLWLSGFISYEFGYFLDEQFADLRKKSAGPLVWFGVSKAPKIFKESPQLVGKAQSGYRIANPKPNLKKDQYYKAIAEIKDNLREGYSYQVNYTFKIKFDFKGNAKDFYLNLRRAQPTSYMAFINTGEKKILSFSPELFFKMDQQIIESHPMKGTGQRGLTVLADNRNRGALKASKKIRAENLMIVDLVRNDLGRIGKKVFVDKLFNVEKYRTLNQMTSVVKAEVKKNIKIQEVLRAIFPCGSVTGAPKIKTMKLIHSLEKESRGIYTGAIGYIGPRKVCFNVPIRTVVLKKNKGCLGVGGGIVFDSRPEKEYDEALLKAKFFLEPFPDISLIETMKVEKNQKISLYRAHLSRLRKSCNYFSIPFDMPLIDARINEITENNKNEPFKLRVLVNLDGKVIVKGEKLEKPEKKVRIKISAKRTNKENIFLYHKTTNRTLYNRELKKARAEGFFDVLFFNSENQLTEGARTNVFLKIGDEIVTPPVFCGLLDGTFRRDLIKSKKAEERVLYVDDLIKADSVYIANSVVGLIEGQISWSRKKP